MAISSGRLVSLDIFRDLTVAFMIIVNTPGSLVFAFFQMTFIWVLALILYRKKIFIRL